MENIKKELDSLKSKFSDLDSEKKEFLKDFAEFILDDSHREAATGIDELSDWINKVEALILEKKTLEDQVTEINKLIEERNSLEEERKKTRQDIRDLEKANASLYENMGRAGYQAFREGILTDEKFTEIFQNLEEEKEKISTFEVELKKTDTSSGGFFKAMMKRSRDVYLKSNQNLRIRNLTKIYQKTGEILGDIEFSWEANDPLKHAFLPFIKNRDKQNDLTKKDEQLFASENEVRDKMESLGVQRNSGKRLQELAEAISLQSDKLDQEKIQLGQFWWEMDVKNQKDFKIPTGLKERKSKLDKKEAVFEEQQNSLERRIRINELTAKLNILEKDGAKLENRIELLKGDLERKRAETDDARKELESLTDKEKND